MHCLCSLYKPHKNAKSKVQVINQCLLKPRWKKFTDLIVVTDLHMVMFIDWKIVRNEKDGWLIDVEKIVRSEEP